MKNILGASDLNNINTNDIFGSLSSVQIIIFFVCVGLALLVGLFLGACIFFPAGVKSTLKQIRRKKAEILAMRESKQMDDFVANEEKHKVSTVKSLNYSDADYMLGDKDSLDMDDLIDDDIIEDETENDTEGASSVNSSDIRKVFYGDKDYMALVDKRKKEVPVINRNYLVNKINAMEILSNDIDIVVNYPTEEDPYVRVTAGGCTFLYIFVMKKVMKVFLRLHTSTAESAKAKAGDMIKPEPKLGEDWYGLIVSDFPKAGAIVSNMVELSYRYTAQKEFEIKNGVVNYIGTSYEKKICEFASVYNPYEDKQFVVVVNELKSKYNLDYYGKSDACSFVRKLSGKEPATAIEFVGNRPAIYKAGDTMFGILFENYGVVKFIFRNNDKYFENLKSKHNFVKESDFPKSDDWQWYSILIDSTYSKKEIKQIIQDSYNHVIDYNEKNVIDADVDIDV